MTFSQEFSKEFMSTWDKQKLFVMGFPKSGTTWLQLLLDAHPQVNIRSEGRFDMLIRRLQKVLNSQNKKLQNKKLFGYGREIPETSPLFEQQDLDFIIKNLFVRQFAKYDNEAGIYVGDKTNEYVKYASYLLTLFPNAKFVYIVRDVRDAITSMYFHNLRKKSDLTIDDHVTSFAPDWTDYHLAIKKYTKKHPGRFITVKFEDMLENTHEALTEILAFLEIPTSALVVDKCVQQAKFESLTQGRQNGEEERNSHFRKGISGDWKNILSAEQASSITEANREAMLFYHYLET